MKPQEEITVRDAGESSSSLKEQSSEEYVKNIYLSLAEYKSWIEANPPSEDTRNSSHLEALKQQGFYKKLEQLYNYAHSNPEKRHEIFGLSAEESIKINSTEEDPAWIYLETLLSHLISNDLNFGRWNSYIEGIHKCLPTAVLTPTILDLGEHLKLPESPQDPRIRLEPDPVHEKIFIEYRDRMRNMKSESTAHLDKRIFARANAVLAEKGGILGEEHTQYAVNIYLNHSLETLKAQGITHLCLEYFKDTDASLLDDYFKSESTEIPSALLDRIAVRDLMMANAGQIENYKSYEAFGKAQRELYEQYKNNELLPDSMDRINNIINHPDGFCSLIKKAKALGIPIVPIDKAAYDVLDLGERVEFMNAFAATEIKRLRSSSSVCKPLLVVGELHTSDCVIGEKFYYGLGNMLGLPAISVSDGLSTSFSALPQKPECVGDVSYRESLPYALRVPVTRAFEYLEEQSISKNCSIF